MNNKSSSLTRVLLISVAFVILLCVVTPIIVFHNYSDLTDAGAFGDSFGALNTLFSALAFALLIYTSSMQRIEMELTRKELEKSVEAQKEMANLAMQQIDQNRKFYRSKIMPSFDTPLWEFHSKDILSASKQKKHGSQFYSRLSVIIDIRKNKFKIKSYHLINELINPFESNITPELDIFKEPSEDKIVRINIHFGFRYSENITENDIQNSQLQLTLLDQDENESIYLFSFEKGNSGKILKYKSYN